MTPIEPKGEQARVVLRFREPTEEVKKAWSAVQRAAMDFEDEMGATNLEDVAVFAGELADRARELENVCDDEFAAQEDPRHD